MLSLFAIWIMLSKPLLIVFICMFCLFLVFILLLLLVLLGHSCYADDWLSYMWDHFVFEQKYACPTIRQKVKLVSCVEAPGRSAEVRGAEGLQVNWISMCLHLPRASARKNITP